MSDAISIPQRRCTKCGQEKPATLEFFYKQKAGKFGLASWCKDCHREVNKRNTKIWCANNKQRVRAKEKAYRAANPEKVKAWDKKAGLKYHAAHPETRKAKKARRRTLEANAPGSHTAADILLQVKSQTDKRGHLRCWWCGEITDSAYHVDHRLALSRGGSNWPDNLVIACVDCNLSKNDKTVEEWAGRLF